jgi:hypothetical protein
MHIINAIPDYYTATALFDFEGQNEQELSFKAGDVIVLTDYSDEVRTAACWSLPHVAGVMFDVTMMRTLTRTLSCTLNLTRSGGTAA